MASRKLLSAGGRVTEILTIPARPDSKSAVVQALIIPGNPGSAKYYVPFMRALSDAFEGRIEVAAVSQLGHGYDCGRELFDLAAQIDHKAALIREQLLIRGRPPLVVIGHSIGCYMAIKAVEKVERAGLTAGLPDIIRVICVCPAISIWAAKRTWWQAWLRLVTFVPSLLGCACALVGNLPTAVQERIMELYAGRMDRHAVDTTLGLFNRLSGSNAAYLAADEFRSLAGPVDWGLLSELGRRCLLFCGPKDVWFPQWKWDEMMARIPEIEAYLEAYLRHGFCVSVAQSQRLALQIADKVKL